MELILNFLFWTSILALGFIVFANILFKWWVGQAEDMFEDNVIEVRKIHRVYIEKHKGQMYMWNEDKEFLAQGSTMAQIIDGLRVRFPNDLFVLSMKKKTYTIGPPDWKKNVAQDMQITEE